MKLQKNESIVFIGEEWSSLRYGSIIENSICLKRHLLQKDNSIYNKNADYVIDVEKGRIRRTSQSNMPDWSQNVFYNQESFDHKLYDTYGNSEFTVYIDYEYDEMKGDCEIILPEAFDKTSTKGISQKFKLKIRTNSKINYAVLGDSISTGAEASIEENKYFNRFADKIMTINPRCFVEVHMKALGGEDSTGGLNRINADVISVNPDIVTIAYGMNDQNVNSIGGHFVEPEVFEKNISSMVEAILNSTDAEVVLLTPCLPNPKWKYASGDVELYGQANRNVGRNYNVAVADVQRLWLLELSAGKSHESLLMNNMNHPNDYGHWIYFMALEKLLNEDESI